MGPVVIGGVGGSGTRVVAQTLLDVGFDLGNDQSRELDDLWFNLLFYRPSWLDEVRERGATAELTPGLDLMYKRAHGLHRLNGRERAYVVQAWRYAVANGHFGARTATRARASSAWVLRRATRFLRSHPARSDGPGWGWKEPISHLVAADLLGHFPDARYIHVIRHGLDMAFSGNRRQVRRFATMFDLDPVAGRPGPREILRYWIRANQRIVDVVRPGAPARLHVLVFDRLCETPMREIAKLLDFLDVTVDPGRLAVLSDIPTAPASIGRFRSHDLDAFDPSDLDAVEQLGFSL